MGKKERIWKYYMECENVFTSEYNSRLLRSLHNIQEILVVQRIDFSGNQGSSYIIIFIDASFIKTKTLQYWIGCIVCFNSYPY